MKKAQNLIAIFRADNLLFKREFIYHNVNVEPRLFNLHQVLQGCLDHNQSSAVQTETVVIYTRWVNSSLEKHGAFGEPCDTQLEHLLSENKESRVEKVIKNIPPIRKPSPKKVRKHRPISPVTTT